MIRVPMLEDQISQSEFFYEKICLVLFSQTNFDCMWEKKERPELSDLYMEQQLEEFPGQPMVRKIEWIEKMPEGLREAMEITN